MFNKEDIVVNKKGQVCKIVDVLYDYDVGLGKNNYYVLMPCFVKNNDKLKLYIPVDRSDNVLRSALSKEQIISLIDQIPSIKEIRITNPKLRKNKFRELYDTGNPIEIFRLIKSFEKKKRDLVKENKFLSFTDENFLKEIKTNIYNELSIGLNINVSEVEEFIRNRLS